MLNSITYFRCVFNLIKALIYFLCAFEQLCNGLNLSKFEMVEQSFDYVMYNECALFGVYLISGVYFISKFMLSK